MIPRRSILPRPGLPARRALPLSRPELVYARDSEAGADEQADQAAGVLLVEDDYLVANDAEIALSTAGFHVVGVATTAEEAIEMAAAGKPALAVMDIRLAGRRDGIEAALDLFERHGIRCIFATAHDDMNARARAQPSNPLGWLAKPYSMSALVDLVRRSLAELRGP